MGGEEGPAKNMDGSDGGMNRCGMAKLEAIGVKRGGMMGRAIGMGWPSSGDESPGM